MSPYRVGSKLMHELQPILHIEFDINLLGNCDSIVAELCRRAGWELQHNMLPAPGSTPAPSVVEHAQYDWAFTVTDHSAVSSTASAEEST
jgi:hypothetical protein